MNPIAVHGEGVASRVGSHRQRQGVRQRGGDASGWNMEQLIWLVATKTKGRGSMKRNSARRWRNKRVCEVAVTCMRRWA